MDDKNEVGNIKIAQKKHKSKKKKTSDTPFITKVFIWFMFIAMLASFLAPLVYYLIRTISNS